MIFSGFALKPVVMVFSGFASKPVVTVFFGLASKPVATVSPSLTSKSVARVFRFRPQNRQLRFDDLCLKITVMVSCFGHQNQVVFDLSVVPQNRRREDGVGHASRSGGFAWKQVMLGFLSLASRLARHDGGWYTWNHHEGYVGIKLRTDESMRWTASNPATLTLLFSMY
jgi:hypothetical protein